MGLESEVAKRKAEAEAEAKLIEAKKGTNPSGASSGISSGGVLDGVMPLLDKFPASEIGKVFLALIQVFFTGGVPKLHAIVDIKEKSLGIWVYDGDRAVSGTTVVDL